VSEPVWVPLGAAGFVPQAALTTSLPASPVDGQRCILTDSLTAGTFHWLLQYVAARASNKWVFIGGAPQESEVATGQGTNSTSYTDLATVGPSIALPVAGDYIVRIGYQARIGTTSQTYYMSYAIGATAAADADACGMVAGAAGDPGMSNMRSMKKLALPAVTLTAKYRITGGTGPNGGFINRWMEVEPIAVGG